MLIIFIYSFYFSFIGFALNVEYIDCHENQPQYFYKQNFSEKRLRLASFFHNDGNEDVTQIETINILKQDESARNISSPNSASLTRLRHLLLKAQRIDGVLGNNVKVNDDSRFAIHSIMYPTNIKMKNLSQKREKYENNNETRQALRLPQRQFQVRKRELTSERIFKAYDNVTTPRANKTKRRRNLILRDIVNIVEATSLACKSVSNNISYLKQAACLKRSAGFYGTIEDFRKMNKEIERLSIYAVELKTLFYTLTSSVDSVRNKLDILSDELLILHDAFSKFATKERGQSLTAASNSTTQIDIYSKVIAHSVTDALRETFQNIIDEIRLSKRCQTRYSCFCG